jgi:hypothetical protein
MVGQGTRHNIAFRLRPGASNLTLSIDAGAGSSLGPGDRDVGIGVTHALVCRADDLRARQDFMMRFPELQEKLQQEDHMIVDVMEIPAQRD